MIAAGMGEGLLSLQRSTHLRIVVICHGLAQEKRGRDSRLLDGIVGSSAAATSLEWRGRTFWVCPRACWWFTSFGEERGSVGWLELD
jgi:hypothetical protein